MTEVDWGHDQPPAAQRGGSGWFEAPEAPMWAFLPALWPRAYRQWVPDDDVRLVTETTIEVDGTTVSETRPWGDDEAATVESDINVFLEEAGLPPRPPARLWMLRLPPPWDDLADYLDRLVERAGERGVDPACSPEFVSSVFEDVTHDFAVAGD
jgi:hypothetical protein